VGSATEGSEDAEKEPTVGGKKGGGGRKGLSVGEGGNHRSSQKGKGSKEKDRKKGTFPERKEFHEKPPSRRPGLKKEKKNLKENLHGKRKKKNLTEGTPSSKTLRKEVHGRTRKGL